MIKEKTFDELREQIKLCVREINESQKQMRSIIDKATFLSVKEKKVMRWRYVFNKTRDEVAKEYGVTWMRVKQLEDKCLEKIRQAII